MTVDAGGNFTSILSGVGMQDKTLFVGSREAISCAIRKTYFSAIAI
jgi:hypothetical protein